MGFRAWWRWKSQNPGGRPKIDRELRDLVRRMCEENPLWGAPQIHGELLELGFTAAQSTVSKYMLRGRRPPSQGWKIFLRNHADGIAAVDFLVVPTLSFERLSTAPRNDLPFAPHPMIRTDRIYPIGTLRPVERGIARGTLGEQITGIDTLGGRSTNIA